MKQEHTVKAGYSFKTEEFHIRCTCGWVRYGKNQVELYNVGRAHESDPLGLRATNRSDLDRSVRR